MLSAKSVKIRLVHNFAENLQVMDLSSHPLNYIEPSRILADTEITVEMPNKEKDNRSIP